MPTKISQMTVASTLTGGEYLPMVQSAANVRAFVSQLGGSVPLHRFSSTGTAGTGGDDTSTFLAAAASGENVLVRAGSYRVGEQVELNADGKAFFGDGILSVEIVWTGSSGNVFAILAGRPQDFSPGAGLAHTGIILSGFKLTAAAGSVYDNFIFVQDGVFHSYIDHIRVQADLDAYPSSALIRLDSGGARQSYSVGVVLSNMSLYGGGIAGVAVPCGIWVESAIEALFDSVRVFNCEETWRLGTSDTSRISNVANCTFEKCQGEIGDRNGVTNNGNSLRIYQAREIEFNSCKFPCGTAFYRMITFNTGGTVEIPAEANITGATSGATAKVSTVDTTSGSWGAGTAAGTIFISEKTGSFLNGENIQVSGVTRAVATSSDIPAVTNQNSVRFSTATAATALSPFQSRSINFSDCSFWGMEFTTTGLRFDSTAFYGPVNFYSSTFYGFTTDVIKIETDQVPRIENLNPTYTESEPKQSARCNFEASRLVETFTINNLTGNQFTLQQASDTAQYCRSEPLLIGHSTNDLAGMIVTGYKKNLTDVEVRMYNRSGGNITVADGYFYTRAYSRDEIVASTYSVYNPISIASAGRVSTTIMVPGVALGDFVAVGFGASVGSDNLNQITLIGVASAADTVTAWFINRTNAAVDLPAGNLVAYKVKPLFDFYAQSTFDLASLAANAGASQAFSVPGAAVGDIACFSMSVDMAGIVGYPCVTAGDEVTIRFQNESGGVVDLASCTIRIGVYKRHKLM